jgi:hypothetical protein
MAENSAGTPIWVDLSAPDVDASVAFYGDLFGWQATEPGPVDETGGYRMFSSSGKVVAGVGPLQDEQQPPMWTTYVGTDDADATARKVEAAGGTLIAAPFDVMDAGRMAIAMDPSGAAFGVWQPNRHQGGELFNEPVSLTWNEVHTRDPEAVRRFYSEVFGWDPREQPMGDFSYTTWFNGVRGIGGMMPMGDDWPAEVPPHWMSYFAVADADATVARAQELGGTVQVQPMDIPPGRFAVITDPQGATFAVIQATPEAQEAAKTPEGVPT